MKQFLKYFEHIDHVLPLAAQLGIHSVSLNFVRIVAPAKGTWQKNTWTI